MNEQAKTNSAPSGLDYAGFGLSGVSTIANIYSAIQAEREQKRRAKLEAEMLEQQKAQQALQNQMAQQQVLRNVQASNQTLNPIQDATSMNNIQNLLNLYNQGNRTSVVGA